MTSLPVNAPTTAAQKSSRARSLRMWASIHRWTSIISTLSLLILCLTGLFLIFQKEIDEAFSSSGTLIDAPVNSSAPTLDSIVAGIQARHADDTIISLEFAKRWPLVEAQLAPTLDTEPIKSYREVIDLRTGCLTQLPQRRSTGMQFFHALHADLFLGLTGGLFLAGMALVVIASIISGLVLYPPFVRRFGFAAIRTNKSRKVLWLDLHNLTGIITMAWLLLVATTGAINTLHGPVSSSVRQNMSHEMRSSGIGPSIEQEHKDSRHASIDAIITAARDKLPTARVMSLFFPGAGISPPNHYVVLMKDQQMMTQELFYAALIDARSGKVSDVFEPRG